MNPPGPAGTFAALGPLAVTRPDGTAAAIGGVKRRLLLALLVNHDQAVGSERLADLIWAGEPSRGSAQTLQSHISQLRKQLGPDSIETVAGGYRLAVGPEKYDVLQFEDDLARARESLATDPASAADCAAAALGRWRGPALADADDLEWAEAERARLGELRLQAEEIALEARLAAGQHLEVISSAEAAVVAEPIREQRWAVLMRAFYRAGRQADALGAYQRLRATLLEELGIDPSPGLRSLEEAILRQDPELDEPAAAPAPTPGEETTDWNLPLPPVLMRRASGPFVGREEEQGVILEALKRTATQRQVVVVSGEAGIGKSALVAGVAATTYTERTSAVVYSHCLEGVALPYALVEGVVEHLVRAMPESFFAPWFTRFGPSLTAALPAIGWRGRSVATGSDDEGLERMLLFRGVRELLASAARQTPLLLVLEDLHWIDHSSGVLLRYLLDEEDLPLTFLITMRDFDGTETAAARDLRAHLHRTDGLTRVGLTGLGSDAVLDLTEHHAGQRPVGEAAAWADELRRETGGNPLFVREVLLHLLETGGVRVDASGRWNLAGHRAGGLPSSVVDVLTDRVNRLGSEASEVLRLAAVIGRSFPFPLLCDLAAAPESLVLDALGRATRAGLLAEDGEDLQFTHSLVQRSLYDTTPAVQRAHLHRRIAEALETTGDPGDVRTLAHHWVTATLPADAAKAIECSLLAGELSVAELAPLDAIPWFERALELLDPGDSALRCRALVGQGSAQQQAGLPEHRTTLVEAAQMAIRLEEGELLVQAALANNRGGPTSRTAVDEGRLAILDAALAHCAPAAPERARLLASRAIELVSEKDPSQRHRLADDALTAARTSGDRATLLHVLHLHFECCWTPDTLAERSATVDEMEALAADLGDDLSRFRAAFRRVAVAMEGADPERLGEAIREVDRIAERTGQPYLRWLAAMTRFADHVVAGRLADAEEAAEASLAIGTASGEDEAMAVYGSLIGELRLHQGRMGELVPLLEDVAKTIDLPGLHLAVAMANAEADRTDAARRAVQHYAVDDWREVPFDEVWLSTLALATEIVALIGMTEAAPRLYELMLPYRDQMTFTRTTSFGSVERCLGVLAALKGSHDTAQQHFDRADTVHERMGSGLWSAYGHLSRGWSLWLAEDTEAHVWLERAAAEADDLGADRVSQLAARWITPAS